MSRMRISYASLVRNLDLGKVVVVLGDRGGERGAVAALGAVLDVLAEGRDVREAVRVAHALHAVAELAQLLEIRGGERDAQRVELLVAVLHEHRNQVLEVLRDGDAVVDFSHGGHYSLLSPPPSQGLSDADGSSAPRAPQSAPRRRRPSNEGSRRSAAWPRSGAARARACARGPAGIRGRVPGDSRARRACARPRRSRARGAAGA